MEQLKQEILKIAKQEHSEIIPIPYRTIDECFEQEKGILYFWFSSEDGERHIISIEIRSK